MSKFACVVPLLLAAFNLASALRCNVENPDVDNNHLFQTNFIRMLLAKRHDMRMAHVRVAGDDNVNNGNEDEECPAGYDYCIRRVCNGKTLRGCAEIDEGHTPEEICAKFKPSCEECHFCREDDCN